MPPLAPTYPARCGSYPSRLRSLTRPPAILTLRGGPIEASTVVALVGSRRATLDAAAFARSLAAELARAGVVVVSGRSERNRHGRASRRARRGRPHLGRRRHRVRALFSHGERRPLRRRRPRTRHDDLVVRRCAPRPARVLSRAQSRPRRPRRRRRRRPGRPPLRRAPSGRASPRPAQTPLGRAPRSVDDRRLRRFASPPGARGATALATGGALPLPPRPHAFLRARAPRGRHRSSQQTWPVFLPSVEDPIQIEVLRATSETPRHSDEIAILAHITVHAATAALLTLALQAVVVEGPPGFFRRNTRPNH